MAKNREAALKRLREKSRLEKREAKQAKKEARRSSKLDAEPTNEQALWEEFARLNERHEAGEVSLDDFEASRQRIMESLGLESDA